MLNVIIGIIGVIVILFVIQLTTVMSRGAKKGALVALSLFEFERIYSDEFEKNGSSKEAFSKAFKVLRKCPDLGELNDDEFQKAGNIIMESPKPELFVHKIIIGNNARKTMLIFKDIDFLIKLIGAFSNDIKKNRYIKIECPEVRVRYVKKSLETQFRGLSQGICNHMQNQ